MGQVTLTEKIEGNVARSVNPRGLQQMLQSQIEVVRQKGQYTGAKRALILGGSASYGLASRVTAAFGQGAATVSVGYARPPKDEFLGAAGWWNQVFFKQAAEAAGLVAKNFNANAFLPATKRDVIHYIQSELDGPIDLLVYSIAAAKRVNPFDPSEVWRSVIKPIGKSVTDFTVDLERNQLLSTTIDPATPSEIAATEHVMGGEDWELWVQSLQAAGVLAPNCKTILFSYEGPAATAPIYHDGTLGRAKRAAEASARQLQKQLLPSGGEALISVNRSVTTKASVVIPGFSRYCTALYQVEQALGTHERPIEQQDRLFRDMVYGSRREMDTLGRLRPDAMELSPAVQTQVATLLPQITPINFTPNLPGYQQFRREFRQLSGFAVPGVTNEFDEKKFADLAF
ncbi:trans-2-enoyl-CoA reductase [Levilactobacillus koreensis JCM 16448]|uniref:enoyl-[acyl-carrier-protein] reductase FabV n=1 Tax=Levilactobacillus koreensis TaxID=637971 RepID=UPI0006EF86C7|nr:enoyl-[acyl-carrier-protein] reductase FabV [Levilactobacillus koreensis]KRK92310.1 trans-2-enoyl-CoA reductase [Levilactobacillus koreensis JCM 16448]